jgi:acetate kinase
VRSSVLVVNAGSTSLKLDLVDADERSRRIDDVGTVDPSQLVAVAHRVVHGGSQYRHPVLIDDHVEADLTGLSELAPLHNQPAIAAFRAVRTHLPDTPQVAVFDTGFHKTIPTHATTYALPRRWREEFGIRRYGFHGLSVEWSTERAAEIVHRSASELRLVVCHLGGGCSVTGVRAGNSVDTSMGFSPLEGVPMLTRSGSVDPAAVLHAMRSGHMDAAEIDRILNTRSGLTALANVEGGMQDIQAAAGAGSADARLAIEVFAYRVAGAVAAMAVATGGLDLIVFTAGIGEASADVRYRVCRQLSFLGVELDTRLNDQATGDSVISQPGSRIHILVVRAREELVAARAARALLEANGPDERLGRSPWLPKTRS